MKISLRDRIKNRRRELLSIVMSGKFTTKDIAEKLGVHFRTVQSDVNAMDNVHWQDCFFILWGKTLIQQPKKQKPWKKGELRLMMKYCGKKHLTEIVELINNEFGNKRTANAVEARGNKNGFAFGLRAA